MRAATRAWPLIFAAIAASAACVPPPRMCGHEIDCGAQASCVVGRCVAHGATAAVDNARRMLIDPVDVGWVQRGEATATPRVAVLGRTGDPGVAFLRFALPLQPEAKIVEAYVLLERASDMDADPAPVAVHAVRVVSPWDGQSLSWARQPHTQEVDAPVTVVLPSAGPLVRVDVREIVQRWRRRDRDELGVALVAEGESATGIAVALGPMDVPASRVDPVLQSPAATPAPWFSPFESRPAPAAASMTRQLVGPRLEIYVR